MKTLSVIGAGAAGAAITKRLIDNTSLQLLSVCNHRLASAQKVVSKIGAGYAVERIDEVQPADIVMVGVPETQLEPVYAQLPQTNSIVFHLSALEDATILPNAFSQAKIHPIKSFFDFEQDVQTFPGTYCVFQGDPKTYPILSEFFTNIGAKMIHTDQLDSKLYHTAITFAMSFPRVLTKATIQAFTDCGLDTEAAQTLGHKLIQEAVTSLAGQKSENITLGGPITRGEVHTVEKQFSAVQSTTLQKIYQALGTFTVEQNQYDDNTKQRLLDILAE